MERIAAMAGGNYPVIRIMPNTPCAVGAGVVLYDANALVTGEQLDFFTAAMAGAGLLDRLEERLIDAGSAVAGCGPRLPESVSGGSGRRRRDLWSAPAEGSHLRRQVAEGTQTDAGDQPAPGRHEGCSVLPRRLHHRRSPGPGGTRLPAAAMDAVISAMERNRELGK